MARRGLPHGRSGHRFAFLTVTAALGAVGVGLVFPPIPGQAETTEASMASTVDDSGEISAQAAAAIPQAQARAHTIAAVTAERTAAAQAAQAAASAAEEHANAGPDDFRAYAKQKVGASQFSCLDKLWTKESNWNPRAYNRSSGAYGIPQALPGSKMATVAGDWRYNPLTQVRWGLQYIAGRYGTACSAWHHSQATGWY